VPLDDAGAVVQGQSGQYGVEVLAQEPHEALRTPNRMLQLSLECCRLMGR
jgi:hypothetical protein